MMFATREKHSGGAANLIRVTVALTLLWTLGAFGVACSGESAGAGDACRTSADCDIGTCVEGVCVAPGSTSSPPPSSSSTPPLLDSATPSSSSATSVDISTTSSSGEGRYLDDCQDGVDCESGICISSPLGRVCTRRCTFNEECEEAAGWRCQFVQGDRDLVQICYPDPADLCEPCTADTDCGGLNDRCMDLENGAFCAQDCRTGGRCPEGYVCVESPDETWAQCLPPENRCGDCRFADTRSDPFHCGECDRVCEFERGLADCINGECVLSGCDLGWENCDEDVRTGCETNIEEDVGNCGACDAPCPADGGIAACVEGACTVLPCPSGEIFCEGACRAPNACNGCTALVGNPEDACGACDTGVLICEGTEALTCTGETDPLTDPNHCGEACLQCPGDQPCINGSCGCAHGEILCGGNCQAPNACGGCATLAGTPEVDACGACDSGVLRCEGTEALTCTGETDTLTDPSNCGEACLQCAGNQICREGTCGCPDDQILCGDNCQTPNACGGCATLAGTPEVDACGACDSGVLRCDPEDHDTLFCTAPEGDRIERVTDFAGSGWPEGWTSSWLFNSEHPWQLSTVRSRSAGQSAHVRGGNSARSEHHLVTAPFTIPSSADEAQLRFFSWLDAEGISFCFDGAGLDISTNDGATWSGIPGARVLPTWDRRMSSGYGNPREGDFTWCTDHDWREVLVDLSPWQGQTIRVRFWFATDNTLSQEGWYVDDVTFSHACPP